MTTIRIIAIIVAPWLSALAYWSREAYRSEPIEPCCTCRPYCKCEFDGSICACTRRKGAK